MNRQDHRSILLRIGEFEAEHRALDQSIAALVLDPEFDQFELRRMKKRKLTIKDEIARLRSELIPDKPAWKFSIPWEQFFNGDASRILEDGRN